MSSYAFALLWLVDIAGANVVILVRSMTIVGHKFFSYLADVWYFQTAVWNLARSVIHLEINC